MKPYLPVFVRQVFEETQGDLPAGKKRISGGRNPVFLDRFKSGPLAAGEQQVVQVQMRKEQVPAYLTQEQCNVNRYNCKEKNSEGSSHAVF